MGECPPLDARMYDKRKQECDHDLTFSREGETHLTVLHPHRDVPKDITYTGTWEIANCAYCLWQERNFAGPHWWRCRHPRQRYARPDVDPQDTQRPHHRGRCIAWNYYGDCQRYTVSRWTRIMRFFGLRRPAWGDR